MKRVYSKKMDHVKISFEIKTNTPDKPVTLDIFLNDNNISSLRTNKDTHHFEYSIPDIDSYRWGLKFVMSGKSDEHMQGDDFTKHTVVSIENLQFENISVDKIIPNISTYTHNTNGYTGETEETFHGVIGHNGSVMIYFETPIYLWLVENL